MVKKTNHNQKDIIEGTTDLLKQFIEDTRSGIEAQVNEASNRLKEDIFQKVTNAIDKFYETDLCLLKNRMNEVTVSGRLAFYLQELFVDYKGYFIDIEYYRLKVSRDKSQDIRKDRIRCDILLHSRQYYENRVDNLLAIEVKLENSIDDGNSDMCRLEEFVLPESKDTPKDAVHSTLIGMFLRFGENGYSQGQFTSMGYVEKNVPVHDNTNINNKKDKKDKKNSKRRK